MGTLLAGGWREWVIGAIILLALYVAFLLWRMRREEGAEEGGDAERQRDRQHDFEPIEPIAGGWRQNPAAFAGQRVIEALQQEVGMLDNQVIALRRELAALRQDTSQQIATLRAEMKTTQQASPFYGEAVQLAMQGLGAAAIADRLGITLSEAEMVASLAGIGKQGKEK